MNHRKNAKHSLIVTHWGTYQAQVEQGVLTAVTPFAADSQPSLIGYSLPDSVQGNSRVRRPAVRLGFLQGKK